MIADTSIQDVMTKNVVSVSSEDNIWDIEQVFRVYHLRHAPVCEEGEVVGMISLIDLRRNIPFEDREDFVNKDEIDLTASQIMARDPVTIQSDQTVKEAALIFAENEFHAIPVLERENLVGIISTSDIIQFLMDSLDDIDED